MTLVLILAAGIAFAIWRIQRVTPGARPAAAPPAATAGRCQAPLCAELATVNVNVMHGDVMQLCMGHGLPLLTEGLTT